MYGVGSDGGRTTQAAGCAACTNALVGQYYSRDVATTVAPTTNNCPVSSCTNAGNGQYYTSAGGTTSGSCLILSCTNATVGQYYTTANSCATAPCSNSTVGKYWTSAGAATADSCLEALCVNAAANEYYTSHGGTNSRGCRVQRCTIAAANQYYSGSGGTSAPTSDTCPRSTCTNAAKNQYYSRNASTTAAPTTNNCPLAACTNARAYEYYSGAGGSLAPTTNSCPVSNCTNAPPSGFYWSSGGGLTAGSCVYSRCANPLLNNQYYSSGGDANPQGCGVSACINLLALGQYYSANGFDRSTGCAVSPCANKPADSVYTPGALNLGPACAFQCLAGSYLGANSTCQPCPHSTFSSQGAVGGCSPCVAGVHYPGYYAAPDPTRTGLQECVWLCNTGYSQAGDSCLVATTTSADRLAVQKYALVLDAVNSTHTRVARLNFSFETTETLSTVGASVTSLALAPSSGVTLLAYAADSASGALYSLRYSHPGPVNVTQVAAGLRALSALPRSSSFALALARSAQAVVRVDLGTFSLATLYAAAAGSSLHAVACSRDGSFAVLAMDSALYRLPLSAPHVPAFLAGDPASQGWADGAGSAARLRAPSGAAVSPDGAAAYLVHPAYGSDQDCVLRRVDLGSSPAVVTTVLRHPLLARASLSFGLSATQLWTVSPLAFSVVQLELGNGTEAAVSTTYGNNSQGVLDDLRSGSTHTEKFQAPSALSVWACSRPGYDCGSDPLFGLPCPVGRTSDGAGACQPCLPGAFAPAEASASCTPCGAGEYAKYPGSTACYQCAADCAPGTYRVQCGGATDGACSSCPACQADQFPLNCSGFSPGACAPCPTLPAPNQYFYRSYQPCATADCENQLFPGEYYSYHGGTSKDNCSKAPCANKPEMSLYTPAENLGPSCAYECLPGHAGPSCSPCPRGTYARGYGSQACTPCDVGAYSPNASATACLPCAPGTQAPTSGSTACSPCQGGFFADAQGTQNCVACQAGSVSLPGSSACERCQAGYVADPSNLTHCQPCPPASASALPGMTACSPCRQGYVASLASSSCVACGPGTYASSSLCVACGPGTYSAGEATACSSCPSGQVPSSSAGPCRACDPGAYANASACQPCAQGTYSTGSATACSSCPGGQVPYSSAGPCAACPGGSAPQPGTGACAPCPRYTFSASAGAACAACVQGLHYPAHASLRDTEGNAACDFRCDTGYVLSADRQACDAFDATVPSFTFTAYVAVPASGFIDEDVAVYSGALADTLGVAQSSVFTTLIDDELNVVVQSATREAALSLASTVKTDAYQRALNERFSVGYLSVPVVDRATVQTSFEVSPPPPPAPPPPPPSPPSPPTVINVPTQLKSGGSRALPCSVLAAVVSLCVLYTF